MAVLQPTMKRCEDGTWRDDGGRVVYDECADWFDLGQKLTCMMDFAAKNCTARDSFMVTFKNPPEQAKKSVRMTWFSSEMSTKSQPEKKDQRDYEGLLRENFQKYDLVIEKIPYCWTVDISTPSKENGKKHLVVAYQNVCSLLNAIEAKTVENA